MIVSGQGRGASTTIGRMSRRTRDRDRAARSVGPSVHDAAAGAVLLAAHQTRVSPLAAEDRAARHPASRLAGGLTLRRGPRVREGQGRSRPQRSCRQSEPTRRASGTRRHRPLATIRLPTSPGVSRGAPVRRQAASRGDEISAWPTVIAQLSERDFVAPVGRLVVVGAPRIVARAERGSLHRPVDGIHPEPDPRHRQPV